MVETRVEGDLLSGRRSEITFRGAANCLLAIACNGQVWKGAVDAVEGERFDGCDDALDRSGVERDVIGIALHEADPAPVWDDLDRITRQERAQGARALRPVEHGGSGEVAAAPSYPNTSRERLDLTPPVADATVRPHDPLGIIRMDVDRNVPERAAPLHHSGVVMQMGDGDRREAAQFFDVFDGGVVEQRHAIP